MFSQVTQSGDGLWEMCRSLVIRGTGWDNFAQQVLCGEKVIFIHSFEPLTPQANHKLSTIVINPK
jgi:hypothetical protein